MDRGLLSLSVPQGQHHEQSRMTLETGFEERPRNHVRLVREQLRLDAVNSGRLLQRLDDVRQQTDFDLTGVRQPVAVHDVEIANNSLAAFIDEKRIAEDAS